ncbi:hypothetical protein [Sporomusa sp. KB1]|jgi:hypothetical protein|uniref:hypothetical protein n=1 Tax=Sporomusa sp. KB1 TaxID=943346 RepID=UPI001C953D40|nr:hypothetical protein [Sporomusa sp. KB1]
MSANNACYQATVIVGTIMEKTRVDLTKWFLAIYLVAIFSIWSVIFQIPAATKKAKFTCQGELSLLHVYVSLSGLIGHLS